MNKAEKKFRAYAILVIFVLLTVLLAVINGVNFTMAARDADMITQTLSERHGEFERNDGTPPADMQASAGDFRMGPMGPESPETDASIRYFTFAFDDKDGNAETVAFHISAVTEDEALEWARSLRGESTGWTKGTYRYRVYHDPGRTLVTVIDQGRELLPSYRILIISAVGESLCLLIGWFVLLWIGRKIYAPLEEADRDQKNFIRSANKEFRIPLTIIGGNTELAERRYGPDDQTRSTRRQLGKLNELVDRLGTMGIFEDDEAASAEVPVSELLASALEREKAEFAGRGIELTLGIAPDIRINADPQAVKQMIDELIGNAKKYALTKAHFALDNENGFVRLETENDADLPDGPADQAFDRFAVLGNATDPENSAGLGLAYVKEIVKAYNGRASAQVAGGIFKLCITL